MAEAPAIEASETRPRSAGRIVQITGPVVDVEFAEGETPDIYTALEVERDGQRVVLEVEQALGNNWVRTVSMAPTEGLKRGDPVTNTGGPITVPVGPEVLGRVFNVVG